MDGRDSYRVKRRKSSGGTGATEGKTLCDCRRRMLAWRRVYGVAVRRAGAH